MKLLRCHVDGFGCLSDYDQTFSPGLSVLRAENGFGKTTLSDFIVAMFYGLPAGNGSTEKNLRKKYAPWQGGAFGGWLEWESGGTAYRTVRKFGARSVTGDSFALYTLPDLRPGDAFSARTGQELFALSESSFRRCVCMASGAVENLSASDVQARLNRLLEDTNDINNLDTALERLREARRERLAYRGNGGTIMRLEAAAAEKQREKAHLEQTAARLEAALREQEERKARYVQGERERETVRTARSAARDSFRQTYLEKQERIIQLQQQKDRIGDKPERSGRALLWLGIVCLALSGVIYYVSQMSLPTAILAGAGLLLMALTLRRERAYRATLALWRARRDRIEAETADAERALEALRTEYGTLMTDPPDGKASSTDEQRALEIRQEELRHALAAGEQTIRRLRQECDRLPSVTAELTALQRRRQEEKETCRLLDKTMELLSASAEELSESYLDRLRENFSRHLELLGLPGEAYLLDSHLEITREAHGEPRAANTESSGGGAVLMLAMRLALVDALFDGEPPFLLLDDPLTELDERRMEKAKELLRTKAKHYQIIYMVCHSSREI